jgi:phenylacetate-CoA ligase
MPREELAKHQQATLDRIVRRASAHSLFYIEKWAREGVRLGGAVRLEDLPFTTREELTAFQQERWEEALCVPKAHGSLAGYTGSQGLSFTNRPLKLLFTQRDLRAQAEVLGRCLAGIGVRKGDHVYLGESPQFSPMYVALTQACARLSARALQHGTWRSQRTVDAIMTAMPPNHLVLSPSFALFLHDLVRQRNLRLPLKTISGWGEPGYSFPEFRRLIESRWTEVSLGPVRVYDIYGLMETGPVAYEGADQAGLEVSGDRFLVEVVDPRTGKQCTPGEVGELVITTLEAEALPLIRYRTGDATALHAGTRDDGRAAPRLAGILGRLAEGVEVAGQRIYPGQIRNALAGIPRAPANFRILWGRGDALRLILQADGALPDLGMVLTERLGVPVELTWKAAADLPRYLHRGLFVLDGTNDDRMTQQVRAQWRQEGLG